MSVRILFLLCVVLVLAAGCGRMSDRSVEPQPPPAPPPAKLQPQSEAAKASLRRPTSAAATVIDFWRYVGTGALLPAQALYDEEVAAAVGEYFGAALAAQHPTASGLELHVYDVERTSQGTIVYAEALAGDGNKGQWSFFLRREAGRWRLVYDSFTAGAINFYVQQQVQRRIDPKAKTPSPEALDRAERVVTRFREAALDRVDAELEAVIETP